MFKQIKKIFNYSNILFAIYPLRNVVNRILYIHIPCVLFKIKKISKQNLESNKKFQK